VEGAPSYASQEKDTAPGSRCASLTVPELEQSKTALLSTLASAHSRRSYGHAIEKFIAWYCAEPRLGFNRFVVLRYRIGDRAKLGRETPHELAIRGPQRTTSGSQDTNGESLSN
jgi:hypothetical protein